jgi:uncharacterized membrane protein YdbT with pleckstrin-like domain
MGYVNRNLMPNESVIHTGKIHWFVFVPGTFWFLVGWLFWIAASDLGEEGIVGIIIASLLMVFAIISLFKAFIFKISTELAITTRRVIAKTGFISRNTVELNHSKVESYNVDQSILGRIFGFGTVIVCGTGGGKTPVPNIDNPLAFRREAMNVADQVSNRIN